MPQVQRTIETDIAVLQTEFKNLDDKFADIKEDVKQLGTKIDTYAETTQTMLKEFQHENQEQHAVVEEKIHSLEKWRWMLMGAGMLVGIVGYSGIEKFLLH
jgi:chromosome segregation ATPase